MRLFNARQLANLAPSAGPIPDSGYSISESGARWKFRRNDGREREIEYVLGSGKSGMTYVGDYRERSFSEFRMSYVPRSRTWYVTPGQESAGDLELGTTHGKSMARRCMLCHAVTLPENSVRPNANLLGVGCESCHGPASEHIRAAKLRGAKDLKIDSTRRLTAAQVERLCARCHRSADDVALSTLDASSTQRFQPYGLEMSPCYKQSDGKLSCTTCHDPHTNASSDKGYYERICLSCHVAKSGGRLHERNTITAVCRVNPREGCVKCHMPQRKIFPGSKLDVTMADHLILARRVGKR